MATKTNNLYFKDLPAEIADLIEYADDDHKLGLYIVDKGEWVDGGKFATQDNVYKYQDKYWNHSRMRTGDYWSGYDFDNDQHMTEVEPVEVTITQYKVIRIEE